MASSTAVHQPTPAQIVRGMAAAAPADLSKSPLLGILGVIMGAGIVTLAGRMLTLGLADLKGHVGIGFDDGAWIGSAFNVALMFIGPFTVYLGGLLGPRRVLLIAAAIFTLTCTFLPLIHSYSLLIALLVIAGLASGTFYPLTLTFALRNIPPRFLPFTLAFYASCVDGAVNFAPSLYGWFRDNLSWHWMFWISALLTPVMMICIYYGIPAPTSERKSATAPSFAGFLYASAGFAMLFAALDQGERLDWWRSGIFTALFLGGSFFLLTSLIRRLRGPNPLVDLPYLRQWNTVLLAFNLMLFRFVLLATIILVPQTLAIHGFEASQIGPAVVWTAVPQLLIALVAALLLLENFDTRLIMAIGFACIAFACYLNAGLTSVWSATNFNRSELLMGVGQSFAFVGLVSTLVLQAAFSGGLSKPQLALTFSAFFHVVRLFGGQIGVAFLSHYISQREKLHSNLLGLHVQPGNWIANGNLRGMTLGLLPKSSGLADAAGRAAGLLGGATSATGVHAYVHRRIPFSRLGMCCRSGADGLGSPRPAELWRPQHGWTDSACSSGGKGMKARSQLWSAGLLFLAALSSAQAQNAQAQDDAKNARHLTLSEAVQLALQHNHEVRLADLQVQEKQYAKDVAKSNYYPMIRNETRVLRVTDTQSIQIPEGGLGTAAGSPIPDRSIVLSQGGQTFVTSGTELVQPLTQLYTKVKPANELARAELNATRANTQEVKNEIALQVHELYYRVLIAQLQRSATEARIKAAQELQSERSEQVKYGSALDQDVIESRAQSLQATQQLLTTELELSDLTTQLDDITGLPLTTALDLDPTVPEVQDVCEREVCLQLATQSHPKIVAAREDLRKAMAGVQLSKADYLPDISAFARYSYQDNVPFLARNFGTFGVQLTYDLFDGGRRRAELRESDTKLAQAKENLARVTDEVELRLQVDYNKLQRTREMMKVSEELLALRSESNRVVQQQFQKGSALQSQTDSTAAQEFDAKTTLLQSQLDFIQARDEVVQAMGLTP